MSTHVAPSAATIAPRSIPRRYVYTSVHDGLRCLQPMWVQCLGFTRQLSATYCAHLVLISITSSSPNVPFNFLHPFGFICRFPPVGLSTTSCLYAVSIYEFLLRPCAAQQLPACIWFQYLGFSCLSTTSCAHLVSIPNFPPCASHQTSLTSCIHWASISIVSRECSAHLLVTHWVSYLLPILPSSSQFLLFTPQCPTWEHSPGFNI